MTRDERALAIMEDRKLVLGVLNLRYPNYVAGDTVYKTVLGLSTEFTRRRLLRDLTYLCDKGYVKFKGLHGIEAMSLTTTDCAFALTAHGFDVANRLTVDPTLDV
ncbi:MAG: hypothetical protein ABII12_03195 [Planctomycetota bacterium]